MYSNRQYKLGLKYCLKDLDWRKNLTFYSCITIIKWNKRFIQITHQIQTLNVSQYIGLILMAFINTYEREIKIDFAQCIQRMCIEIWNLIYVSIFSHFADMQEIINMQTNLSILIKAGKSQHYICTRRRCFFDAAKWKNTSDSTHVETLILSLHH